MKISQVTAVYFSPAGSTQAVTEGVARQVAEELEVPWDCLDFTLPGSREKENTFSKDQLVVFGTPTYAGRIPNKILPFVQTLFHGNDTPAIALVTFGNRNYDSSLKELRDELLKNGFQVFAGAAFACRHVFSDKIAPGRPDEQDMEILRQLSDAAVKRLKEAGDVSGLHAPVVIKDNAPVAPYYTPLKEDGKPAKFLKAKPKTYMDKCDRCGICAKVCPMGSVKPDDPADVPGICIKCQACVKKCPQQAKYFDDPDFLSHVAYLEKNYIRRAKAELFLD